MSSHVQSSSPVHPSSHAQRRRRFAIALAAVAVAATTLLPLASASPAHAHDQVVDQRVAVDAASGKATGVELQFNNDIMQIGTEIRVTDATGADLAAGTPVISARTVTQPLTPTNGDLQVVWRVVSSDGHPIQGQASFVRGTDGNYALHDGPLSPEPGTGTGGNTGGNTGTGDHITDHTTDGHEGDHAGDASTAQPQVTTQAQPATTGDGLSFAALVIGAVGVLLVMGIIIALAIAAGKRKRSRIDAEKNTLNKQTNINGHNDQPQNGSEA